MSRRLDVSVALLGVFLGFALLSFTPIVLADTSSNTVSVFPLNSKPYGLSYGEWTGKWWQWLLSISKDNSPLNDGTGKNCDVGQNGPVWFLAGTTGGVAERTCTIPAGKAILLAPFNAECTYAEDKSLKTVSDLHTCAKSVIDPASGIHLTIDGVNMRNITLYRVTSPVFNVNIPLLNVFSDTPGQTQGVSDGFFIMIHPLSPGQHFIEAGGSIINPSITAAANFVNDVKWHLAVH